MPLLDVIRESITKPEDGRVAPTIAAWKKKKLVNIQYQSSKRRLLGQLSDVSGRISQLIEEKSKAEQRFFTSIKAQ